LVLVGLAFLDPTVFHGPRSSYDMSAEGLSLTRTAVGQRVNVPLPDQSQMRLGGNSSVRVRYTLGSRKVLLYEGEIRLTVKHDQSRPLDVVVGHLLLRDLGTQFDVLTHDGKTTVSVTEGEVRVLERKKSGEMSDPIVSTGSTHHRAPVTLKMGDLARLEQTGDGTVVVNTREHNLDEAKWRERWLQGEVITSSQRLDEVVWEFNRYYKVPLRIDDPAIAATRIGGHFYLSNREGFLQTLLYTSGIESTAVKDPDGATVEYVLRLRKSRHVVPH